MNLAVAPQGFGSRVQLTRVAHTNGVPCAFPKPSANCPLEVRFFDVAKPITLPVESKTGPPELPGLIGAVRVKVEDCWFIEEIIPVVSIPACPRGDPMTPTHHPCFGADPIHSTVSSTCLVAILAMSLD